MIDTENKGARLLDMYERLSHGEVISKKELAEIYGVTVKTIQRDIDELRAYLAEKSLQGDRGTIEYSPAKKGYRLVRSTYEHLNHKEILALAKILLESRALEPGELHTILDKLTATCIEKDRTTVEGIIKMKLSTTCRFITKRNCWTRYGICHWPFRNRKSFISVIFAKTE